MIRTALEFIELELNNYIQRKDPVNFGTKDISTLSNIVKQDGELAVGTVDGKDDHSVIITLVNIEECRHSDVQSYFYKDEENQIRQINPAIHLNLHVLFTAYSDDYKSSLRNLSYVISFFQTNSVFTAENYPNLNSSTDKSWQKIQKLIFNHQTLTLEQQNNLWGSLGAKYIPSVLFRMRILTFQEKETKAEAPSITEMEVSDKNL